MNKLNFIYLKYCKIISEAVLLSKHITAEVWKQFHCFKCGFLSFSDDLSGDGLNANEVPFLVIYLCMVFMLNIS